MTTHIQDSKLELFFLDSSQLGIGEHSDIEKHISQCSVCKDNLEKIKNYYSFIEGNINKDEFDDSLAAEKILRQNNQIDENKLLAESKAAITVLHGGYEIIEHKKNSLAGWIKDFVRYNPLKFSGSLALVGIIAALLFYYNKPEMKFVNPSLAVIEKNVLYVYNEMGNLLWKKGVPGMRDYRTDSPFAGQRAHVGMRELLLDDLDKDGINDLLLAGNFGEQGIFASDTLYCFDNESKLKWKYGCGGFADFNTQNWKYAKWYIMNYFTYEDQKYNRKRLYVTANSSIYAPAKIFELDFDSGKILQEFYNAGGFSTAALFDFGGDGKQEIFLGGINNGLKSAFIAVFDPDSVKGFSPSTDQYIPSEFQKNAALRYILMPRTNYSKIVGHVDYNSVDNFVITEEGKTITAYIQEVPGESLENHASVLYNFDNRLSIEGVVLGDNFINNYNRLFVAGKVKEPLDTNYTKKIAAGVKYLE